MMYLAFYGAYGLIRHVYVTKCPVMLSTYSIEHKSHFPFFICISYILEYIY
jgi:hypothetical protein